MVFSRVKRRMIPVWLLVSMMFVTTALADDGPVVDTEEGSVRGFYSQTRSGRRIYSFTGIPFAKPPVGKLRFRPPEPVGKWSGVKNAVEDGPWCLQIYTKGSKPVVKGQEDCLHLSVFTFDTKARAPVLVHIHGGAFSRGDKSLSSPAFMLDEDVVVVDINYRVGVLGFLSFEEEEMPGNQGMKDQVLALQWVKRNIAAFGGDPDSVTIVGESAGAASVTHHIMSPLSRGLFHRAISESGTSYNTWGVAPPGVAKSSAQKLAKILSCPTSTQEAVACISSKDVEEILRRTLDLLEWQIDPLVIFMPALEPSGPGAFLTGPVSKWEPNPVPLLIGTTSAEATIRTNFFINHNLDFKWYNDNFEKVAPASMMYSYSASDPEKVTKEIRRFYFGDREISVAEWTNLSNMYTDGLFTSGIWAMADVHPGDVFFYFFDYLGENTFGPKNKTLLVGAAHADEIIYLWNATKFRNNTKGEDKEFSKKMVKIWTHFAKHGEAILPEPPHEWDKWTKENHNYVHISNDGFKPKEGLLQERYNFWKNLSYWDKMK